MTIQPSSSSSCAIDAFLNFYIGVYDPLVYCGSFGRSFRLSFLDARGSLATPTLSLHTHITHVSDPSQAPGSDGSVAEGAFRSRTGMGEPTIAEVVILKNLELTSHDVQIQALEVCPQPVPLRLLYLRILAHPDKAFVYPHQCRHRAQSFLYGHHTVIHESTTEQTFSITRSIALVR